jgi:hypothetical protein
VPFNGVYRNDRGHRNHRRYECRYNDPKFNGTDKRCYCRRVDADWLEATVWAEVSKVLWDPERLLELARQHLDLRSGELRAEASQIGGLDRRLAEAKRKRTNLALAAAATGPDAVADALAEVNRDIEALEQMRERARAWAQANAERSALLRDLWKLAETARGRLDDPTPERMREVVTALDIPVQLLSEVVRRGRRRTPPDLRIMGYCRSATQRKGEFHGPITPTTPSGWYPTEAAWLASTRVRAAQSRCSSASSTSTRASAAGLPLSRWTSRPGPRSGGRIAPCRRAAAARDRRRHVRVDQPGQRRAGHRTSPRCASPIIRL